MKAELGFTKLTEIPHSGKEFEVIWNPVKGNYKSQRDKIEKFGAKYQISSPQLASLLEDAKQGESQDFPDRIIEIMDNSYFRSSTESLWIPKTNEEISNWVIVYDNSNLKNSKFSIKKSELLKKLENADELRTKGHPVFISKDKSVRFTPLGFETGEMNNIRLSKNPYNIALHLEEGAEKIAEFSSKEDGMGSNLFAYKKGDFCYEKRTVSVLGGEWGWGRRLGVSGIDCGDEYFGFSLGVLFKEKK